VKPPAGDIAGAADALGIPDVIVLANHKNVVLAARQAATLARCTLHVVPTETLPQGVAAAIAFDPDATVAENLESMQRAASSIRTVEVTSAGADRSVAGISIRTGDAIAILDGQLVAKGTTFIEAMIEGIRLGGAASAGLVTVYGGSALCDEERAAAAAAVRASFPGVEVEAVAGGQPLYPLVVSVES
jgi:uncharacterized protein